MSTRRRPVVEGWFASGPDGPHLIGSRCASCATITFPAEHRFCRNPRCSGTDLPPVALSRFGRVWSYTDSRYQPPLPFVAPTDPFEPFAVAAVELEAERIVVLGMVDSASTADLAVGMRMELVEGVLDSRDGTDHTVWKWRPAPEETA